MSFMDKASGHTCQEASAAEFVKAMLTITRDDEIDSSRKMSKMVTIMVKIQLAAIKAMTQKDHRGGKDGGGGNHKAEQRYKQEIAKLKKRLNHTPNQDADKASVLNKFK